MNRTLFPELEEKTDLRALNGLKIVKITTTLHDSVKSIQLIDEHEETHELTFQPVDSSYIAVKLDGDEIANLETEV